MPVPMATGTFRKMKAGMLVSGPRRYSIPNPKVVIPQPIQIAYLYRPVMELPTPTAVDIAGYYEFMAIVMCGLERTCDEEGLWKNSNAGDDWCVSLDTLVIKREIV